MSSPHISIITATRNCADALKLTLASLQIQTYQNYEWVIQDCLSTDETCSLVKGSGLHYSLASENDLGIYDALNKAISRCRGEWVLCLGAGDWLAGSTALATLAQHLDDSADIAICNVFEITTAGQIIRKIPDHPTLKIELLQDFGNHHNYKFFLEGMPCHQGILIRRPLLTEYPFDCSFRVSADWNQLMHLVAAGFRLRMIDHFLSWYPNGGFSAEHSHLWIEDVCSIVSHFSGRSDLAKAYFNDALQEHYKLYESRINLRTAIEAGLRPS